MTVDETNKRIREGVGGVVVMRLIQDGAWYHEMKHGLHDGRGEVTDVGDNGS